MQSPSILFQIMPEDWKQGLGSQGHKNWCGLEYGEEDLDWEVKPVVGKGLGIIAKRMIPAKYRIMVESVRPKDHPRIRDLMPANGTLEEKIELNRLGCEAMRNYPCVCLRICRLNHDCDANSHHTYDKIHQVKVLIAGRDIQEGEEITISYSWLKEITGNAGSKEVREMLRTKFGIVCKDDCICHDKQLEKLVDQSRDLDTEIVMLGHRMDSESLDRAMEHVKTVIQIQDQIRAPSKNRIRTLHDGFQIGVLRRKTLEEAMNYLRMAYELESAYAHPNSDELKRTKALIDDPSKSPCYLFGEGGGNFMARMAHQVLGKFSA